jgi:hypothetical protein
MRRPEAPVVGFIDQRTTVTASIRSSQIKEMCSVTDGLSQNCGAAWPWSLGTGKAAPMTTPEEYRKYADECLKWAYEAQTDDERRRLLDLANSLIQAASLQEKNPPSASPAKH